ncbi:oocyte zinc finger protein XlCOF19-like [Folsomia candida]|uniref:Zinc finger protein 26 n=1 Tax=Folsomia candida TaxID=158441 RepID=A0A226DK53_FOLCA|nr:oocyte zinc finger protein XlCOF19-like [Folsomia candida]OXA45234.1 Zinc finger protein 26 [Folsomia candida]
MDLKQGKKRECSKPSRTYSDLSRHVVTHDPDAQVKCEVCRKIFKNRDTLSGHISRIHGNRKRPSCDTCHRVFSNSCNLRRHIDDAHGTSERPRFPCGFSGCEKTFVNKYLVSTHMKTEHVENPIRFPCTLCGKDFKTRTELGKHIRAHTTEKPYTCASCGRSFAQMGTMKRHEMTHLEKSARDMFQCHVCPQTFLNRTSLQHHIRVGHENQRNYPCSSCDKRFSTSRDLMRHVEAVHATNKEKIHSCDKCEYKSHSKANLANHRVRHNTMARRHGCYFCGKKFYTFFELVSHCQVHTFEKLKYLSM